jgi:putative ABC transport system substrate-binding protein
MRRIGSSSASIAGLALVGGCQLVSPPAGRQRGYAASATSTQAAVHSTHPYAAAFLDRLRELGWVEAENLASEWRFADGRDELVPEMAVELARLPVELIFSAAAGPQVIQPETSGVPIVEPFMNDPRLWGIENLARPGGNVTGLATNPAAFYAKSLELLKTILPNIARLAVIGDHSIATYAVEAQTVAQTASALGIDLLSLDVRRVEDLEASFASAQAWGAGAFLIISQTTYTTGVYARVAELCALNRLPSIFAFAPAVTEYGGLLAHGADLFASYRHGAEYVAKILRGARPADLPVEAQREFQFIVNVNTALALGITFPPDAAAQVTEWMQQ